MARNTGSFAKTKPRSVAFELLRSGDSDAWNNWRQSVDIFGDHLSTRVNLAGVHAPRATLSGFNLTNVSLYRASLSEADLSGVDCGFADFHEANLIGCDFSHASLRNARLSRAYMRGARLDHANLRGADLRRASLTSASLVGADIRGVDLTSTRGLIQEQLDDANGDGRTRVPPHLVQPSHWLEYEPEDDDEEDLENLRILPATVEVAVVGGTVQLSERPGDAAFSSSVNANVLRQEILQGLERIHARCGNLSELQAAIGSYAEELRDPDLDIIIVGVRALKIQTIFEAVIASAGTDDNPELLPDIVGSIRATLIQHYLFINQSHRWRAFLEEASMSPYEAGDRDRALQSGNEMSEVLHAHQDVVDGRVPKALARVTDEVEITDDRQKLAVFNLFASIENLLKGLISWTVREARRLVGETWGHFRADLAKVVGKGMARLLVAAFSTHVVTYLAATYPERFAWLTHAVALLHVADADALEE
ncbi:pentapeptide repeat-containing protein [Phenylobacterium sp.]|uniref:pentapeptide repeat-containing protein n=1 Tax=Phenylobacterium sp. TaxID=1871053 RepID=UPI0027161474|nr:pentapeptide repeat-containing protein [Phenylobacterium sp.]MDO8799490.1 pentapeptide repeat-containing protein [Phenylobacterium sp.]